MRTMSNLPSKTKQPWYIVKDEKKSKKKQAIQEKPKTIIKVRAKEPPTDNGKVNLVLKPVVLKIKEPSYNCELEFHAK